MPTAIQLANGNLELIAAIKRSRKLLNKRAAVAAAASAVPIPGFDWAVDAAMLSRLIPELNHEFGLSAAQLDKLPAHQRENVQKAAGVVGSMLIGKIITRDLVVRAVQKIGVRLTAKQIAKFLPIAGQAVAALIGYAAVRYLGEEHMKDCVRVAQAALLLPAPTADIGGVR